MLVEETKSVQKEIEILVKKALGPIPNEEEEKDEVIEDITSDKPNAEELPKGVKIIDFELDNKYMQDDPSDTESVYIIDGDTSDANNVANTTDNVDVFEVDVKMFDAQQEQVENKGEEKEVEKSSTEQLVSAQSIETQTALVNASANANVKVSTKDNQKDSVDKEEEVPGTEQTIENPQPVKDTTNKEETIKDEEEKKKKKVEDERRIKEIETSLEVPPKPKLKKTIVDDDDDNESMSIKGPINMDNLSYLELMQIATTMQSWAQKKY
ncbi:midasin-like [Cryptomeria japonica]|uniref:midasin-like n=1 Tax=Cryptomeria japonica TaxID=3369 RepID=UPI0027DA7FC0|nr:midasin-like [Cryptomeria japonica]